MPAKLDSRKYGWKKDPDDARDKKFGELAPLLEDAWSPGDEYVIEERTPPSNQLDTGTCVANAGVDAFEIIYGLDFPDDANVPQLSRLFAYWIARLYNNDTDKDDGTNVRVLFNQLAAIGVCLESTWPFNPHEIVQVKGAPVERIYASPSLAAFMEADSNKIAGYYRIVTQGDERLDEVEKAVRADHPVVFGTGVTRQFEEYRGGDVVFGEPDSSDILGLHAMIIVGVRNAGPRRHFLWRNSWGNWGNNQHVWVDESYVTSKVTQDLWVATQLDPVVAGS